MQYMVPSGAIACSSESIRERAFATVKKFQRYRSYTEKVFRFAVSHVVQPGIGQLFTTYFRSLYG